MGPFLSRVLHNRTLQGCFILFAALFFMCFGSYLVRSTEKRVLVITAIRFDEAKECAEAIESNLLEQIKLYNDELIWAQSEIKVYESIIEAWAKDGRRISLGTFTVTAYDPSGCVPFNDGVTSTGLPVGDGIFAVNPKKIPYGSVLYIPQIGKYGLAGDTGAAMRNNHKTIDVFIPLYVDALAFGRKRLEVQLIRF